MTSRRDFMKYCSTSGAALGLTAAGLLELEQALANPAGPTVLWLQGAACTGCSVSFMNRISPTAPTTAADVLINYINLAYHPNLMAASGESAVAQLDAAYTRGGYVLAVEGGVPTAFGGATCWAYTRNGQDVTMLQLVQSLSSRASAILSIGTCAAWGGIPAAGPNPTGVKGVAAATGKPTINVAGCPPHPDWIVWAIVQLVQGKTIARDSSGRPSALYASSIHDRCPRKGAGETKAFGDDGRCLKALGCRGPNTRAQCPSLKWNNARNWCVDANAPCHGCTEPSFPGTGAFYKSEAGNGER